MNRKILRELTEALAEKGSDERAKFMPQFLQAYEGGYGEGDAFLGVSVPDARKIAKRFQDLRLPDLAELLRSQWHECRLTAVFILVDQFQRASKPRSKNHPENSAEEIKSFYLNNLEGVNNWDLVDSSAHKILGEWLVIHTKERKILKRLAKSKVLWEQRVAVIATLPLIRLSQFEEILDLAEFLLHHPHDLMHKAVGWMLRELGKRDIEVLRAFLSEFAATMPRTMLRYAIEKMSTAERKKWLTHE